MATVAGTYTYDDSDRELDLDYWCADGWEDALIDAFLDGAGPDELLQILQDYITDDFYREMLNDFDVDYIDWDPPFEDGDY